MRRFHQLGLSYELWIDGSFTTEKEEPKDIDAVFFVEETELVQLDQQAQEEMVRLFHRDYKQEIMIRYNCDVYLELTNDQGARRYWKKQFGTYRDDQTPKGIARIESATQ